MISSLESERLKYIPLSLEHLSERYVEWLNDPEIYRYLESGGNYTYKMLEDYLIEVESKKILFWGIHLKSDNKHIGNIKIDPVSEKHGWGEYGIILGDREEWGKGYAFEASQTIIKHCFDVLNLRKINLGVVQENLAAVKLYTKLGFNVEGLYKYHIVQGTRYLHSLRMAIFNNKFKYQ